MNAVADSFSKCERAHSEAELDEWLERAAWRQMRLEQSGARSASLMHALTERFFSSSPGAEEVLTERLPAGVQLSCDSPLQVHSENKKHQCEWRFEVRSVSIHFEQLTATNTPYSVLRIPFKHTIFTNFTILINEFELSKLQKQ